MCYRRSDDKSTVDCQVPHLIVEQSDDMEALSTCTGCFQVSVVDHRHNTGWVGLTLSLALL
jgi:hypothetical protein